MLQQSSSGCLLRRAKTRILKSCSPSHGSYSRSPEAETVSTDTRPEEDMGCIHSPRPLERRASRTCHSTGRLEDTVLRETRQPQKDRPGARPLQEAPEAATLVKPRSRVAVAWRPGGPRVGWGPLPTWGAWGVSRSRANRPQSSQHKRRPVLTHMCRHLKNH